MPNVTLTLTEPEVKEAVMDYVRGRTSLTPKSVHVSGSPTHDMMAEGPTSKAPHV